MSWIRQRILKGDKGLGDTIERFTTTTGIKNLVEKVSVFIGKDCMCEKRKHILNDMFSYDDLTSRQQNDLNSLINIEKFHLK
jgi:hypothetical protein